MRFGAQTTRQATDQQDEADEEEEDEKQTWSPELREAERLVAELIALWGPPIETLSRAGRAFDGLEFLLGGGRNGTFDLQVCSCFKPVRVRDHVEFNASDESASLRARVPASEQGRTEEVSPSSTSFLAFVRLGCCFAKLPAH